MTNLFLDFESRSEISLPERGLDNYLRHPSTKPLMLGWALDDEQVNLWQPHIDGKFCSELRDALSNPHVRKIAFNVPFEYGIFKYLLGQDIPLSYWDDVLIMARHLSVTGDLEEVGKIFGLPQDQVKIKDGSRLIQKFCSPCYAGGEETLFGISQPEFRDWDTDPTDWQAFCNYCIRDVESERALFHKMQKFPLPELEHKAWELDHVINNRGLFCDLDLVRGSAAIAEETKNLLRDRLASITGVSNPNSDPQVKAWLQTQGYTFSGLAKGFVSRALSGECDLTPSAREVLELRRQAAKTSDSKLARILETISEDGRLRNQYAFMGAARTSRWSSLGGVQVQNLPRPTKEVANNLERGISLLKAKDFFSVSLEFASPMDVVSSTIRSIIKAAPGKKLLVCDLNAIEFRALGWITSCDAINRVFRDGRDPYIDFGTDLYGKPYEDLDPDEPGISKEEKALRKERRQNAKPGVLGGGYQLSAGQELIDEETGDKVYTGLMNYARGLGIELNQELASLSIAKFREKYDDVVKFWYEIQDGALSAFRTGKKTEIGPFVFERFGDTLLRMMLPSGRGLHYIRPKIEKDQKFKKDGLTYEGKDQRTKQWTRIKIYGGKWVENGDQSLSRDILVNGMFLAEKKGLNPIMHSHDELVCEVDKDSKLALDDLKECMIQTPAWAPGLMLGAEGFETDVYRKD